MPTLTQGNSAAVPVDAENDYLSIVCRNSDLVTLVYTGAVAASMPTVVQGRALLGPFTSAGEVSITATTGSVFYEVANGGPAFSPAISFRANAVLDTYTVTGAIAFTLDTVGAVPGTVVEVDLIANGSNAPSFTGFREWGGSSGYSNVANVRNCITFFYRAGIAYYSITQQLGGAAEPGLPSPDAVARLVVALNCTESGSAGAGWNYTGNTGAFANHGGLVDKHWSSGVDGTFHITISHAPGSLNTCITTNTSAAFLDVLSTARGVWIHQDGTLHRAESGVYTSTGTAWALGDKVGLRRVGSNLEMRLYHGGAWSTVYTWAGFSTGDVWPCVNFGNVGATAFDLRHSGLV